MKILVINAGSSSLKYQLLDMKNEKVIAKGNCERIGLPKPFISYKHDGQSQEFAGAKNHEEAVAKVLEILVNNEYGVIKSLDEIEAVGHRVVQGGWIFKESCLVTPKVLADIKKLADLAPLHNPANALGIEACQKAMPNIPHVVVFDTAFHSSMPAKAYTYAINHKDAEKFHIRRYGAHGTSHRFIALETAKILGVKANKLNAIICHLGNGSSVTAVKCGQSVDTSMGLTPLQGVVMGTRSGDIDPTIVQYLCQKKNKNVDQVITYLNKECGLLGVSGFSSDNREVTEKMYEGDENAKLALDTLCYSVKKYVGSYMAVLNRVDAIVFTGGIGENSWETREGVVSDMENLGVVLDKKKNQNFKRGEVQDITGKNSKVKVLIVPTNEELMMARDTKAISKNISKKSK